MAQKPYRRGPGGVEDAAIDVAIILKTGTKKRKKKSKKKKQMALLRKLLAGGATAAAMQPEEAEAAGFSKRFNQNSKICNISTYLC